MGGPSLGDHKQEPTHAHGVGFVRSATTAAVDAWGTTVPERLHRFLSRAIPRQPVCRRAEEKSGRREATCSIFSHAFVAEVIGFVGHHVLFAGESYFQHLDAMLIKRWNIAGIKCREFDFN